MQKVFITHKLRSPHQIRRQKAVEMIGGTVLLFVAFVTLMAFAQMYATR